MPLTPQQVEQFHAHGYVAAPRFFSPREVRALQAEVSRFQREGLLRNVATEGDGTTQSKTSANLQLIPLFDKSNLLRALPFAAKVREAISLLIGDPFILPLDQLFLKPGRHGAGTAWHQDNAYFKINDPLMGTAMWTAVHIATVANGTIHVIPDSFRQVYEHTRDPYSNHHIRCSPPEENAIPIELEAGGVAFFCYGPWQMLPRTERCRDCPGGHYLLSFPACTSRRPRTGMKGRSRSGSSRARTCPSA